MFEINNIYHADSLVAMNTLFEQGIKVDLIIADPPYLMPNTKAGGNSKLAKSIQGAFTELEQANLTKGITYEYLDLMVKLQDKINIYIWCNLNQIKSYLDYFIDKHKCKWDEIIWYKTNAMPCYHNKYLTDKEYCLYIRKGGYCNPQCYEDAKTVHSLPINIIDKRKYGHPTIKPLSIIETLIRNSSHEGDLVLDPFAGSGTTLVASKMLNRNFIGFEIEEKYVDICKLRLMEVKKDEVFN